MEAIAKAFAQPGIMVVRSSMRTGHRQFRGACLVGQGPCDHSGS